MFFTPSSTAFGFRTSKGGRSIPTKPSVSITRIAKTRDQQPLEGVLPQVKGVAFVLSLLFQLTSSLDDGGHNTPEKTVLPPAGVHVEPRYGKRLFVRQREETMAETSVNQTLTKFVGRLFRVKRDNAACGDCVRWLTARAIQRLRRDVSRGDDAGEQTCKVKFNHRRMNTGATVKVETTSVSLKQVKG